MSRPHHDRAFWWSLAGFSCVVGAISALIVVFLAASAWPTLSALGLKPFMSARWQPSVGAFGLLPLLTGTGLVSLGALAWATPVGLVCAIFRQLYAPKPLALIYDQSMTLMFGLPSVVYGLWGLTVLVPHLGRLKPPGQSLLAGVILLGVMLLPTIAMMSGRALADVPSGYTSGGLALGLERWTLAWRVLVPAARGGIWAGVVLALGRGIGETMALLMVCGNIPQLPSSLSSPVRVLTANIALEMGYALDHHRGALFVSALALMLATTSLVLALALIEGRAHRQEATR